MGKGDKRSKKGKITSGTYGVSRKKKKKAAFVPKPKKKVAPKVEVEEVAEKKAPAKKTAAKKPAAKKKAPAKKPAAKK